MKIKKTILATALVALLSSVPVKASTFYPDDSTKKIISFIPEQAGIPFRQKSCLFKDSIRLITKTDSFYYLFNVDLKTKECKMVLRETEPIVDFAFYNKGIIIIGDSGLIGSPYNMVYCVKSTEGYYPITIRDTCKKTDIFLCNKPIRIEMYKENQFLIFTENNKTFLLTYEYNPQKGIRWKSDEVEISDNKIFVVD